MLTGSGLFKQWGQKIENKRVWIEIALFEQWGVQPVGIPRVTENIFLQSLRYDNVGYFYYHRNEKTFVVPRNIECFINLSAGISVGENTAFQDWNLLTSQLGPKDRVLLLEAGWDHLPYLNCVQGLRKQYPGVMFIYLAYDLIVLKMPQFFELEFGGRVANFLKALPSFCDRYVCISNSTASDIRQILSELAVTNVIQLGSDIHNLAPKLSKCQDTSLRVSSIAESEYILSVGTIEIRKNHILLYFVWRRLALLLGTRCPRLVLVGRVGWLANDVTFLLRNDPVLKDLVEIRWDVPNERLVEIYHGALFTIFPSFYEGWGLPVSESLFYGKIAVTSNAPSLMEINPFPELAFDPYNHQDAFDVIRSLIENPAKREWYEKQISGKFRRQTWVQCFDELYSIVAD